MPVFNITTLGCKVNQYDSCAIASALVRAGFAHAAVDTADPADVVVVNTCCVTATAMRKSRQAVRRAVRNSPGAVVFVTGCYSDYDADRIRRLLADLHVPPEKTIIAGHHGDPAAHISRLARSFGPNGSDASATPPDNRPSRAGALGDDVFMSADIRAGAAATDLHASIRMRREAAVKNNLCGMRKLAGIDRFAARQRAFVKVQDGCDAFCAYCIVPYTRCVVWSRGIEEVVAECRTLVAAGHKEIVLSGVFLGAFGRDTTIRRRWGDEPAKLPELLERIAGIEGLWRVRLSSLEPGDVTGELLAACRRTANFAPHFHLPLQSGSPRILKRMNRQYTADEYRRTVDSLAAAFDRPAITTDIIVGFPGETDADFAETLAMARFAGFAKIHAFPFSAIAGTAAWTYRNEAPPTDVVKRRMSELAGLEAELAREYRKQFIGETMQGLVENTRSAGANKHRVMTDRYQTVFFDDESGRVRAGDIVSLKITGLRPDGLTACL